MCVICIEVGNDDSRSDNIQFEVLV